MTRIEILVEEPSMKEFLSIILPKVLVQPWQINENYFIRSFDGKQDLQKNIPSKIRAFSSMQHQKVGVVILQDQDSSDCKSLKQKLIDLCEQNGTCPKLIRIVCRELEAWYIGDFKAISSAYPTFNYQKYIYKSKYRNPDTCNASHELKLILPDFQKISTAKKVASHIDILQNKSESFRQTINGIKRFFEEMETVDGF